MAKTSVKNDLIPLKAGIVRIIPLDSENNPIYSKAYTTRRSFLTSMVITTTRTSETLPNGNGSDKDYPTDEKYNLSLVTQVYDPKFHSLVAGMRPVETPRPIPHDTTITVKKVLEAYEVDLTKEEPAALEDGKYYFEIRDSAGNPLEQTEASPSEGKFKYDADTHKLSFDATAENKSYSCVYYVAATGGEAYEADPILKNKVFQIEVYAESQSADTGEIIQRTAIMYRAAVTGDLPNIATQKSINSPITYTFSSAPVPAGMSPFYQSNTPKAQV